MLWAKEQQWIHQHGSWQNLWNSAMLPPLCPLAALPEKYKNLSKSPHFGYCPGPLSLNLNFYQTQVQSLSCLLSQSLRYAYRLKFARDFSKLLRGIVQVAAWIWQAFGSSNDMYLSSFYKYVLPSTKPNRWQSWSLTKIPKLVEASASAVWLKWICIFLI